MSIAMNDAIVVLDVSSLLLTEYSSFTLKSIFCPCFVKTYLVFQRSTIFWKLLRSFMLHATVWQRILLWSLEAKGCWLLTVFRYLQYTSHFTFLFQVLVVTYQCLQIYVPQSYWLTFYILLKPCSVFIITLNSGISGITCFYELKQFLWIWIIHYEIMKFLWKIVFDLTF